MMKIIEDDLTHPDVHALIALHLNHMDDHSPQDSSYTLDLSGLQRRYKKLSLETGTTPAFDPALKLYRKYGFVNGAVFADYRESPYNQFLHLSL